MWVIIKMRESVGNNKSKWAINNRNLCVDSQLLKIPTMGIYYCFPKAA